LIRIDDVHPLGRPAKSIGLLDQGILGILAFAVMRHLLETGLAHIDIGLTLTVLGRDLLRAA
jgi:hypothetical protein